MKKQIIFISIALLINIQTIYSQELVDIKNTSVCDDALDISRFKKFGPTTAPAVFGDNKLANFQRAPHPAWYKFTIEKNGILLFDIEPSEPQDNYDFILYLDEPNFCKKFYDGKITAIRSNFDAPEINNAGKTGLSVKGQQKGYDKGIEVTKGQIFYLALNNVYDKGKGHSIIFKNLSSFTIQGNVFNGKNTNPVAAIITWKNVQSEEYTVETETDKKGKFQTKIVVNTEISSSKYELFAYSEGFFPATKIFTPENINTIETTEFNFELNKIKKGYNEELVPIYFQANEIEINPESEKDFQNILLLLQLNPKVEIVLEGHTNGIYPSTTVDMQLSESRAVVIKKMLTDKGIDSTRISIKGFGSTKEIYQMPLTEEEEGFNRRVEINIVKL